MCKISKIQTNDIDLIWKRKFLLKWKDQLQDEFVANCCCTVALGLVWQCCHMLCENLILLLLFSVLSSSNCPFRLCSALLIVSSALHLMHQLFIVNPTSVLLGYAKVLLPIWWFGMPKCHGSKYFIIRLWSSGDLKYVHFFSLSSRRNPQI